VSNEREHGDAVVRGPVELLDHTLLVGGTSRRQTGGTLNQINSMRLFQVKNP